ncbi:DUF5954 family protein [Actinocorallia sp. API 0066]|uniref:DUF5954 family protein n=1 Tax=Actinocorallia sp. API 0066 TaxID=2896846 RepID=UPI001E2EF555|nr:DUF5954 family protein [Actinocorallia sp. API 0066]MCD0449289.1 DUF5954 family protein [Actinocorallia sp. API 0066]
MAFRLMRGYNKINAVAGLEPAAMVRDHELGERMKALPKLFPAGSPDFGFAVQTGDSWRIGCAGGGDPLGARITLASRLRRAARRPETPPETGRAMLAAADKLEPPEGEPLAKDEWEIGDRRYRIIRIEKYTLINNGVMEPPRHTDTDPPKESRLLEGHPIDPLAPSGPWETQLRLNLLTYQPIPGTVPEQIQAEARHAHRTHPGIIVLPPEFTVVEIEGSSYKPLTGGRGPDDARRGLAAHFSQILPRLREFQGDPPTPAELAKWQRAATWIEEHPNHQHEWEVLGRRFRTIRVSRFLRVGRDGPEPPRPSDPSVYDPD